MTKLKKIVATSVMFGLMVSAAPVFADDADRIAELEALVAQLTAQVAALTATPAPTTPTTVACTFTRNLYPGMSGADVKCLQEYLNASGHPVAATGAGSPGNETMYFGSLTQAAVKAWQEAMGVSYGAYGGYFGPMSIARFNETGTTPVDPVDPADPTVPVDPGVDPSEGFIEARWLPTPTGIEPNWGESNVAVGAIELKAKESKITVSRIDINLVTGAAPWRIINYLSLYDGDNAIKGSDISSAVLIENTVNSDYTLRLTGLNITVPKDGTKDITVKVNVPAFPPAAGQVTISVPSNGIRGIDTLGLQQYANITGTRVFTVKATGEGARVEAKINASSPKESIGLLDIDESTKHEVLRFDLLTTRDSAELRKVGVTLSTTTNINAVRLYDGTTVLGVTTATTTQDGVVFDDLKVALAKDSTKTLWVEVEHVKATGTNVTASLRGGTGTTAQGVTAISINGESVSYTGTVTGEAIYFFEVAPEVSNVNVSVIETKHQTDGHTLTADVTIAFTLTAKGGDVVLDGTVATSANAGPTYGLSLANNDGARAQLVQTAGATSTLVVSAITLGGKTIAGGAALDRTITEDQSKQVVITARVSSGPSGNVCTVKVDQIEWAEGTMPNGLLEDLMTTAFIMM